MPKDFLRFKLIGELGTDEPDAAATGIFCVGQRIWADDLIQRLGLPRSIFPKIHLSADIVGSLTRQAATELGLPAWNPGLSGLCAGSADQPAQAVGNGLIDPPLGSITVGTGGQVFIPLTSPLIDFGAPGSHILSRASGQVVYVGCDVICGNGIAMGSRCP